jgi:ABC-2 type transport system ATP-binding protein
MIRVQNLARSYGEKQALRGISFEVPPGQICGLLGPNGAGKSTTVKILTGTLAPTSGTAIVGGFDVLEQPLEVKARIGYVPETGTVYPTLSANEYLALCGALHGMTPQEIASRTSRFLELFGIADEGNRRLDTFSKGMRQKVVISAALLHDPQVVLFDEPLSGLDANMARTIKELLRGLAARGKTVLFCSHVLDVVERLCERVLIIHQGELVADGPTATLIQNAQSGTLEELFRVLTADSTQNAVAQELLDALAEQVPGKTAVTGR